VAAVAQLTGVPEATLYLWRKQAREQGRAVPGDGQNPEQWSSADKFAVVLEAAPLNEAELAAYRSLVSIKCESMIISAVVRLHQISDSGAKLWCQR
jgi:transposase-like protein